MNMISNELQTFVVPPRSDRGQTWTPDSLRSLVSGDVTLAESKRRARTTAINNTAIILRCCGDALTDVAPWTCAALNRVLWSKPCRAFGLSPKAFRDTVSGLRQVLIRAGLHADAGYGRNSMSAAWQALHAALPTNERRYALLLLFRFASLSGIEPDAVTPDLLDQFEAWCRTSILCDDPGGVARRTASNWAFARNAVRGWPDVALERSDMRDRYVLGLDQFSASFRADVQRYLDKLAAGPAALFRNGNPFTARIGAGDKAGDGTRATRRIPRAQRPRSLAAYDWRIRAAATGLVERGVAVDDITSLAVLVRPLEHALLAIDFHRERLRQKLLREGRGHGEDDLRSSNLACIGEVLRQIAVYEARLPQDELDELTEFLSLIRPEAQRQMTAKNADRLRRLLVEPVYSMLLHLPSKWMREAASPDLKPAEAARLAMYACALEILLFLPLRRETLLGLCIDSNLIRPTPGARIAEINIPASMTKGRKPIAWPVERDSARLLDEFIHRHRPALCEDGNRYLFAGAGLAARNAAEFGDKLSKMVAHELGAEFNTHLARHFSAVRYLRDNPGAYEIVAHCLGHSTPEVTRNFYCGLELDAAARHANAALTGERARTRMAARAAFRKPAIRRRARS